MVDIIKKGIDSLVESRDVGVIFKIEYRGKGTSLNDFYSQGHWSKRSSIKKKYRKIFDALLKDSSVRWLDKFFLVMFYNSRHDPDNVVGMEKVFVDALKREVSKEGDIIRHGYIADDNKKYYRGMCIFPDETLEMNTFQFILMEAL